MKRKWGIVFIVIILFCLTSCRKEPSSEDTSAGTYVYTPATSVPDSENDPLDASAFSVNASWQDNFNVTYRYFDVSQGKTPVTIIEKKTASFFSASYLETGNTLYYVQNGSDIEQYILTTDSFTGAKSVMKNKSISGLSSTFMKLSEVSPELPRLSNVLYMSDEAVAGRMCKKFIQRAYSNGEAQETVYVWVDKEYGFAARCEAYDAQDEMTVYWDLVSFSTGSITDFDVEINLSIYQISEES